MYPENPEIRCLITQTDGSFKPDDELPGFIAAFREKYGENLDGVIFYGSCLTTGMRKPSSFRDFFVLLHDYAPMAKGAFDRKLLSFMPPNLYFQTIEHEGRRLEAKYHLLTTREFQRMTSRHAPDHYVIGRMCKRTALVFHKNDEVKGVALDCLADAFFNNARLTVPRITEPVDFKGFVIACLQTSYLSELRLETPEKIEQIYRSEQELYDRLYGMLLECLLLSGELTAIGPGSEKVSYRSSAGGAWPVRKVKIYLWVSKFRHIARFPKMIRNMDNWLDQLAGKYERTYGKKLELSEFEKRHRLLTALKYFYKIKIQKKP